MSLSIKLDDESKAAVEKYAEKRNLSVESAAEKLISVAVNRLGATDRYAAKQRGDAKPAKAKKAAPKVKATKPKGALARKTRAPKKAAPKAPKSRIKVVNEEPAAPAPEAV